MRQVQLVIVSWSAVLLSACVVAPVPPPRVVYAPPAPVVVEPPLVSVDVAPPPPQVEVVPVAPFVGAVWIGGYWGWSGGRHVWVSGHYDHPRPGYQWRAHAWVQEGGRWHLHAGGWVRQ
jgi:hypothetical protein